MNHAQFIYFCEYINLAEYLNSAHVTDIIFILHVYAIISFLVCDLGKKKAFPWLHGEDPERH